MNAPYTGSCEKIASRRLDVTIITAFGAPESCAISVGKRVLVGVDLQGSQQSSQFFQVHWHRACHSD